jgi:ribosome biogenesis GTPase
LSTQINTGRVVTRFGAELLVENNNDQKNPTVRCTAKRKFDSIVCGDFITWHHNEHGNASVDDLLPRTNALTRPGYRGKPRTIAANIDQLVIVNSWLPETSWNLVDRYLIAADHLKAEAVIVMNKSDLAKDHATDEDWHAIKAYQEIGYSVLEMNAHTGEGIQELKDLMGNKTSIFSGRSGVGKSSIANKILPDSDIMVGIISDSGEGKHTTTTANLYQLGNDGYLIDSPGVRDYALGDINTSDLIDGYIEFAKYSNNCRFHNCTHDHEPGCAVTKAVESGEINQGRYQRYIDALKNL